MYTRIIHFGKSIENYKISIENKIIGFTSLTPFEGDIIYFAVKVKNETICGAKAILTEKTLEQPWKYPYYFKSIFKVEKLEYCKPFNLKILEKEGGRYYYLKYFQNAKAIDEVATKLLKQKFEENKTDELIEII